MALKLSERTHNEVKWVLTFGVGTVLLGIGSAVFNVYYYDAAREKDMKDYVKDTVANMEARIELKTRWW
ncbi:hypothetical protein BDZ91DRAFT_709545 [Kalaharituber pfeilii]|nr:hypothetical protein BDZ91DRAFT_709545 [Kalaharituber pfeilii]